MKISKLNFDENSKNIVLGEKSFDLLTILTRFYIYDNTEDNDQLCIDFYFNADDKICIANEICNPDLIALFLTDFFKKNVNKHLSKHFLNYLNRYKDDEDQSFFKTIEKRTEIFNSILNKKEFVEVQRWHSISHTDDGIIVSLLDDIEPVQVEISTNCEDSNKDITTFLNDKDRHDFNCCFLKISFKEKNSKKSSSNIKFKLESESLNSEKRSVERFLKSHKINNKNIGKFFDRFYGLDTDFISNNETIIDVPYTEVKSSNSEIIW